ncbi:rhomboid family intramembrane serine protease [Rhizobiaceae bacterium n13]|uniref:Rhomboid family intramembrane serine protease n=1 Tax=Ferirhizobium litorale TaxID=2927786 RepID=A0AAE3QG43_9HYPH|nr:rhomboid family intramembrane serine protease [Fererhizobium litorale]MDI7864352.1 rhomboid family intramembrane serine protease [Fererhizobium litorale]MDI7924550.1 rhomboid family intramembrane serine protease [Fererhizobium litorale]
MFIPLHDKNALKHIRRQYVTITLIVVNCLAWLFTGIVADNPLAEATVLGLGYIPAVAFHHAVLPPGFVIVPEEATYLTYAFLHTDVMHLAANMVFLWVFGDNVEDALGHLKFLLFYVACAASGALLHGLLGPASEAPLIGASGAVSGVVAAYVMLHPKVRVWVLVLFRIPLPLPAYVPLALWIGQQFVMLAVDRDGAVSWGAHVGGILAASLLVVVLRRRGVPLFDRGVAGIQPKTIVVPINDAPKTTREPLSRTKPHLWGRNDQY